MRSLPTLVLLPLLALPLAACTDDGLVDRVEQLEQADERLRESLVDVGAPDPEAEATRAAVQAEIEDLRTAVADVEAGLEEARAGAEAQSLEVDDRLTTVELQLDDARARLGELEGALTTLTDRVSSLEAQFDAHRGDPSGHGG